MNLMNKSLIALAVVAASSSAMATNTVVISTNDAVGNRGCITLDSNGNETAQDCLAASAEGIALGNTAFALSALTDLLDADPVANIVAGDLITLNLDATTQALATGTARVSVQLSGATFGLDAVSVFNDNTADNGNATGDLKLANGTALVAAAEDYTVSLVSLTELAIDFANDVDLSSAGLDIDSLILGGLSINGADLESGNEVEVTVAVQAQISSLYTNIGSASTTLVEVRNQLGASITTANRAALDINATDMMSFTNSVTDDTFTITVADNTMNFVPADDSTDTTVTVTGDFSFLDADADEAIDSGNTVKVGATPVTFADDFQSFTYPEALGIDGTTGGSTIAVDFSFDGAREIPVMTADAAVAFSYISGSATGGTFSATALTAVNWALEGQTFDIDYMPYGTSISQIIYVTNPTSVEADITVTVYDEDGTKYGPTLIAAKATALGVTSIAGDIKAMLPTDYSGKARIAVTTNTSSIFGYASYNVNGADRGFVGTR